VDQVDIVACLKPFLNIIRSEETSGPITGVALTSVYKFLRVGLLSNSSFLFHLFRDANFLKNPDGRGKSRSMEKSAEGLQAIAEAATHCRFEATDRESDEVVLMKILQVSTHSFFFSFSMLLDCSLVLISVCVCVFPRPKKKGTPSVHFLFTWLLFER
jgi:hypothetical protein